MFGWAELTEEISKVHELPKFLPDDFIKGTMVPVIASVTVVLTISYLISFKIVESYLPKDAPAMKKTRISYQITNVAFNLCVGILGLYLEYWTLPTLPCFQGTSLDRMSFNHEELYLVSAMQLGYQFWAIPVGVLYVGENTQMLMHHFAVVISTSFSGFTTVGFRYYTPFYYGIMELSSLPLSIMNSFKDNPEWIKKYPGAYEFVRVAFAVCFLFIRVYMCASRWPVFLRDNFIFMYTADWGLWKLYLMLQWSLAAFLAYLQLFWAYLILKGFYKMIGGSKKEKKEDKEKKEN
jgi:hypothetical protein